MGIMSTEGESRRSDAFAVFFAQSLDCGPEWDRRGWLVSTLNLQLASLELCRACRRVPTVTVRIDVGTPRYLWAPSDDLQAALQERKARGVPALQPLGLRWMLPGVFIPPQNRPVVDHLVTKLASFSLRMNVVASEITTLGDAGAPATPDPPSVYFLQLEKHHRNNGSQRPVPVRYLTFEDTKLNQTRVGLACAVVWPASVRFFSFGDSFNDNTVGITWPASLRQISFGNYFNQPIAGTVWPASLQNVSFGYLFNQPIAGITWPASLRQLSFGDYFNRPIAGIAWPASLQNVSFGRGFNQPVAEVVWPASLQQLEFGYWFNQPITGVEWPTGLQQLEFGYRFNAPIAGVMWPTSLRRLTFGHLFNQPVTGVAWPASLQYLSFGWSFNQPIAGIMWPASLQQLLFGHSFNQPVAGITAHVRVLA